MNNDNHIESLDINNINTDIDSLDFTPPLIPNQNIKKYVPEEPPKKNVVGIIFSILGFLLATAIMVSGVYYFAFFPRNGNLVLENIINKTYDKLDIIYNYSASFIDNNYKSENVSYLGNINITGDTNTLLNYEYDLDYNNKTLVLAADLFINNIEMSNFIYNYENNSSYILNKKLNNSPYMLGNKKFYTTKNIKKNNIISFYDDINSELTYLKKNLYINEIYLEKANIILYPSTIPGSDNLFKTSAKSIVSYDDYHYLLSKFKEYLIESFEEEDFKVNLNIQKKDKKYVFYKKITYLLQNTTFDRQLDSILDKIQNDEKAMRILFNIFNKLNNYPEGYNEDNVREIIKKFRKDIIKKYDGNIGIEIYIDIFNNSLISFKMSHEGQNIVAYRNNKFEFNLTLNDIEYNITYNNKELNANINKENILKAKVNSFNDKLDISYELTKSIISGSIILSNNLFKLTIPNYTLDIHKNDNVYDYSLVSNNYKLNGSVKKIINENIILYDKSNVINYNSLDSETKNSLLTDLNNIYEKVGLYTEIK